MCMAGYLLLTSDNDCRHPLLAYVALLCCGIDLYFWKNGNIEHNRKVQYSLLPYRFTLIMLTVNDLADTGFQKLKSHEYKFFDGISGWHKFWKIMKMGEMNLLREKSGKLFYLDKLGFLGKEPEHLLDQSKQWAVC